MIPKTDLEHLKPLPDQLIRERMVKSKRSISFRKSRLTNRARQWAFFGSSGFRNMKDYKGPEGKKSFGNISMEKRKK